MAFQPPHVGMIVHFHPTPVWKTVNAVTSSADVLPAIVTRVWDNEGLVNLQVFLDGQSLPSVVCTTSVNHVSRAGDDTNHWD